MIAKIYDKNERLIKVIPKGEFKENHFVWKEGGMPILKYIPIINSMFHLEPIEHKIECNFDEILDDKKYYTVLYRQIGDGFEQIPVTTGVHTGGVEVKDSLYQIELAQARADAIIQKPLDQNLAGTLFNILLVVLLIGILYSIQQLKGATGTLNSASATIIQNQIASANVLIGLNRTQAAFYNWFVIHNP